MGCGFVLGGQIKREREVQEAKQWRKITGKLISCSGDCISFSHSSQGQCAVLLMDLLPPGGVRLHCRAHETSQGTQAVIRVNIRRLGQSKRSKLDLLSWADGVM